MAVANVLKMIQENEVRYVDLRFTDTRGTEQHVTVPAHGVDDEWFERGHAFDGSSIAGWKGIQASDMLLMPDPATANIDPFFDEPTLGKWTYVAGVHQSLKTPGPNDPCPCGSGKKYKKCHGA